MNRDEQSCPLVHVQGYGLNTDQSQAGSSAFSDQEAYAITDDRSDSQIDQGTETKAESEVPGVHSDIGIHGIEELLVQRAIHGEQEALHDLWQSTRRWVAAIILAHKPKDADLEDLLQMVAMHLCRKIKDVRDPKAFKGWLRTVAMNVAREEGRKVTRRRNSMLKLVGIRQHQSSSKTVFADQPTTQHDENNRVYQAAMSLPLGYREPIVLRCLRSMSYQQISEVLDLPITTVETRIARGRRMLREILEHHDPNKRAPDIKHPTSKKTKNQRSQVIQSEFRTSKVIGGVL